MTHALGSMGLAWDQYCLRLRTVSKREPLSKKRRIASRARLIHDNSILDRFRPTRPTTGGSTRRGLPHIPWYHPPRRSLRCHLLHHSLVRRPTTKDHEQGVGREDERIHEGASTWREQSFNMLLAHTCVGDARPQNTNNCYRRTRWSQSPVFRPKATRAPVKYNHQPPA